MAGNLLCIVSYVASLFELLSLTQEIDLFYMDNNISLTAKTEVTTKAVFTQKENCGSLEKLFA